MKSEHETIGCCEKHWKTYWSISFLFVVRVLIIGHFLNMMALAEVTHVVRDSFSAFSVDTFRGNAFWHFRRRNGGVGLVCRGTEKKIEYQHNKIKSENTNSKRCKTRYLMLYSRNTKYHKFTSITDQIYKNYLHGYWPLPLSSMSGVINIISPPQVISPFIPAIRKRIISLSFINHLPSLLLHTNISY